MKLVPIKYNFNLKTVDLMKYWEIGTSELRKIPEFKNEEFGHLRMSVISFIKNNDIEDYISIFEGDHKLEKKAMEMHNRFFSGNNEIDINNLEERSVLMLVKMEQARRAKARFEKLDEEFIAIVCVDAWEANFHDMYCLSDKSVYIVNFGKTLELMDSSMFRDFCNRPDPTWVQGYIDPLSKEGKKYIVASRWAKTHDILGFELPRLFRDEAYEISVNRGLTMATHWNCRGIHIHNIYQNIDYDMGATRNARMKYKYPHYYSPNGYIHFDSKYSYQEQLNQIEQQQLYESNKYFEVPKDVHSCENGMMEVTYESGTEKFPIPEHIGEFDRAKIMRFIAPYNPRYYKRYDNQGVDFRDIDTRICPICGRIEKISKYHPTICSCGCVLNAEYMYFDRDWYEFRDGHWFALDECRVEPAHEDRTYSYYVEKSYRDPAGDYNDDFDSAMIDLLNEIGEEEEVVLDMSVTDYDPADIIELRIRNERIIRENERFLRYNLKKGFPMKYVRWDQPVGFD